MKAPVPEYQNPTWAPARKEMIATSMGSSRIWLTVAQGILTEVYYPRVDIPQIRDLGFIIADDKGFWVELRRLGNHTIELAGPGVPAIKIVHRHERFVFTLRICPSQRRDVVLLRYQLESKDAFKVYALMATRLGDNALNNLAFVQNYNGRKALTATQGPFGLSLAAACADGTDAFQRCSAGCSEASDGWQDFHLHGRMTWEYDSAGPAAVALIGELPSQATLSLGLAQSMRAASTLAVSGLMDDFEVEWDFQCQAWQKWLSELKRPQLGKPIEDFLSLSAVVLKSHEDRTYRGAFVASLSVPWGDQSDSRGGYHLVWTRDLVETAGALLAMEAFRSTRDILRYLIATQQEDGHWFQNQWLGGTAFWQGVQLDEVAFPILLASALSHRGVLNGIPAKDMVDRAVSYLMREGPVTSQDRWEEDGGINVFTMAIVISALVEGSTFLDEPSRSFALRLADYWNASLEDWTSVSDTALARQQGVSGYYFRTAPAEVMADQNAKSQVIPIKNLERDPGLPASARVSTDFLQLVRYGLRKADDPLIVDSVKLVDRLLKCDTPGGPVWHRYNDDGYGEREDGSSFEGTGKGRGWPLLTGERGHYVLDLQQDARPYLEAMMAMSSPLGLIPEQVWDCQPIEALGLEPGRPTGSAMPLVWAHAEFVKLCYSLLLGYPVDRPAATWARYGGVRPKIDYEVWQYGRGQSRLRPERDLCVLLTRPARIHWGIDGWKKSWDTPTQEVGHGVHAADLALRPLGPIKSVELTFCWLDSETWENRDYRLQVGD